MQSNEKKTKKNNPTSSITFSLTLKNPFLGKHGTSRKQQYSQLSMKQLRGETQSGHFSVYSLPGYLLRIFKDQFRVTSSRKAPSPSALPGMCLSSTFPEHPAYLSRCIYNCWLTSQIDLRRRRKRGELQSYIFLLNSKLWCLLRTRTLGSFIASGLSYQSCSMF